MMEEQAIMYFKNGVISPKSQMILLRTTLEHLSQLRISPGVSTQMGEGLEALRAVLPIWLPVVAYQPGGILLLLRLVTKVRSQRVYYGEKCGKQRTVTARERKELWQLNWRVTRKIGGVTQSPATPYRPLFQPCLCYPLLSCFPSMYRKGIPRLKGGRGEVLTNLICCFEH